MHIAQNEMHITQNEMHITHKSNKRRITTETQATANKTLCDRRFCSIDRKQMGVSRDKQN